MRTIFLSPIEAMGICASTKLTLTLEDQSFENQEHVYVYAGEHVPLDMITLEDLQRIRNHRLFGNYPLLPEKAVIGHASLVPYYEDEKSGDFTYQVIKPCLFDNPLHMSPEQATNLSESLLAGMPSYTIVPLHTIVFMGQLHVPLNPQAFREAIYGAPILIDMTVAMWQELFDRQGHPKDYDTVVLECGHKKRSFKRNDLCRIIYCCDEHGNKRLYRSGDAEGKMVPRQFLQLVCK